MRLVVTLLVRDEEDIVADNLSYHLDAGADLILVTDNGSIDSTRDIVESFVVDGVARLLVEPAPIHSQWRWVTRMARTAYWDHGADWVINTDADEFWWPELGDLKDVLETVASEYHSVRVPRFDFRPLAGIGGGPRQTPYRETASQRFTGGPLEPKVCHRGDPRVVVGQGNHEVSGIEGLELDGSGLLSVFHYPTRSRRQFRRGVANAGAAYARSSEFVPTTGEVKRALFGKLESGRLDDVFALRELTVAAAGDLIGSGELVEDRRLMKALSAVRPRPVAPASVVVSLCSEQDTPLPDWMRSSRFGAVVTEPCSDLAGAAVIAVIPTPEDWIAGHGGDEGIVEESAYEWLRVVSSIAALASRVLWVSPSHLPTPGFAAEARDWMDGADTVAKLDEDVQPIGSLGVSTGPALDLARSTYEVLRVVPGRFGPLARLIEHIINDDVLASRLGWYLGPPGGATDVIGAMEARLAGAEASYEKLRNRRSVRVALRAAGVAAAAKGLLSRPRPG